MHFSTDLGRLGCIFTAFIMGLKRYTCEENTTIFEIYMVQYIPPTVIIVIEGSIPQFMVYTMAHILRYIALRYLHQIQKYTPLLQGTQGNNRVSSCHPCPLPPYYPILGNARAPPARGARSFCLWIASLMHFVSSDSVKN